MPLTVPFEIGRYQVVREIGRGGMGAVYLARDPRIANRLVAIKVLGEGFDTPELRERFAREADAAGNLDHPNIVAILDVGEFGGKPFIAMRYVQGETLAHLVKTQVSMSLLRKLQLMDDLCSGLHHAHRAGVIHRDIKPANLMIDEHGTLKILDFGIARFGSSGLTQANMIMGTLNYMAPEQMEGQPVDRRADMFSAGAVLYELLTYRLAFPGEMPAIVYKIMNVAPEPIEQVIPGLDPRLVEIVNRCLEKRPENRYADMGAVRRALDVIRRRLEAEDDTSIRQAPTIPAGSAAGDRGFQPLPPTPVDEEILAIRNEQIRIQLEEARKAFDSQEFTRAIRSCQQALAFDPTNLSAQELRERARRALDVQNWLRDARGELDRGALTAASLLVDRALSVNSASPEAVSLRKAVDDARRDRERIRQRDAAMSRAREQLESGQLEEAMFAVLDALRLEPEHGDARLLSEGRALKDRIAAALDERRIAREAERARHFVEAARVRFAAGDHAKAIASLDGYRPPHAIVSEAAAALREELAAIQARQRAEAEERERRRREEAARRAREEAAERERRRLAEEARRAEDERRRREEEARERLRREEEARLAAERERVRREEEARFAAEVERVRREAEERERLRLVEEARLAAEQRRLEEARRLEEQRRLEEARKVEEARQAAERERRRREEEARLAAERDQVRREEEARLAAERDRVRREEEARLASEEQTLSLQPEDALPQTVQLREAPSETVEAPFQSDKAPFQSDEAPPHALEREVVGRTRVGRVHVRDWRLQAAAAAVIVGLVAGAALWYSRAGGSGPSSGPRSGAPPPVTPVVIDIAPWARIEVSARRADGRPVSDVNVVTPSVIMLPPGTYHLRASNPAFATLDMDFTVQAGAGQQLHAVMPGFDPDKEAAALADR